MLKIAKTVKHGHMVTKHGDIKSRIEKIYWEMNSYIAKDKEVFNKQNAQSSLHAITLMRDKLLEDLGV